MDKNNELKKIFDKFSDPARRILMTSQKIASSTHEATDSQHLLIGLSVTNGTIAYDILHKNMITIDQIRLVISLHNIRSRTRGNITPNLKSILLRAFKIAASHHHISIDSEHLLLAIIDEKKSIAYQIIDIMGIEPTVLRKHIEHYFRELSQIDKFILEHAPHQTNNFIEEMSMKPNEPNIPTPSTRPNQTKALDYFTADLTQEAKNKKIDPIIGREREITRCIQILCRRSKNNVVLIGEPGVGKTAIAEGLAQRLAENRVPAILKNKKIRQLDLALLVAGTTYRGQFEDRAKKIIDEIIQSGNTILFVDELHTLVGAGSAEGSLDLANILKPALAKGQIRLIGATTLEEYRKHIEKDTALERRLQPVLIDEPTPEETIEILRGIRDPYEKYHNVIISDEAIIEAVYLSKRYISDRFLPDKAIDLIDEAAAASHIANPEGDKAKEELAKLEQSLDKIVTQKEKEVETENYENAMKLKTKELQLTKKIKNLRKKTPLILPEQVITKEDIAKIVADWTNIPLSNLLHDEKTHLLKLDAILRSRIVGQEEAITAISKAIRRSKTGVADARRPLGSFIFLGPTGVGKTELAKVLAEYVFGREDALIKVDMSEFMERHNVSRLVGAPPGYVGYEDAGRLTESVRKKPYSVILFDEIEKAHPEIFNILLQILEDGYLTDAKGRQVNFRNTIVILTSNIGMAELNRQAVIGFKSDTSKADDAYDRIKDRVLEELKHNFRPEFLNRLDKIIVFRPLTKDAIRQIVDIQIEDLKTRLATENIFIDIADEARNLIAEKGFDPEFGARPIRRAITEYIEDPLSETILSNRFPAGQTIRVLRQGNRLVFRK